MKRGWILGFALLGLAACDQGPAKVDLAHGETLYAQCKGCHALTENKAGPKHCGLIGRAAATVPGYVYSDAMRNSGLVWDAATLNEFLKSPLSHVNGTKMGFAGFHDARDRTDLIAYLQKTLSDPAACGGSPP